MDYGWAGGRASQVNNRSYTVLTSPVRKRSSLELPQRTGHGLSQESVSLCESFLRLSARTDVERDDERRRVCTRTRCLAGHGAYRRGQNRRKRGAYNCIHKQSRSPPTLLGHPRSPRPSHLVSTLLDVLCAVSNSNSAARFRWAVPQVLFFVRLHFFKRSSFSRSPFKSAGLRYHEDLPPPQSTL